MLYFSTLLVHIKFKISVSFSLCHTYFSTLYVVVYFSMILVYIKLQFCVDIDYKIFFAQESLSFRTSQKATLSRAQNQAKITRLHEMLFYTIPSFLKGIPTLNRDFNLCAP